MFNIIITILLCYLAVRFLIGFVIPVISAALQVRRKVKEMRGHQQEDDVRNNKNNGKKAPPGTAGTSSVKSDYIDFEEVK